jgi:hypothetical protein
MYQTQKLEVLKFLEKNKTINSFQCYLKLQIVDLQHAIYELRKEGYSISDKWIVKTNKKGRKVKYKEYRLEV